MFRASRLIAALTVASILAGTVVAGTVVARRGGSTGGTTTTGVTGTFSVTPATVVVLQPEVLTFKYGGTMPTSAKRVRIGVPTSYDPPQIGTTYDELSGVGIGEVTTGSTTSDPIACNAATDGTSFYFTLTTGCQELQFIGRTRSTGGAKFPVSIETTPGTWVLYTTLTVNASSAKVNVTFSPNAATASAGDYITATAKVTDSKGRALRGVLVAFTDTGESEMSAGTLDCTDAVADNMACSNSVGDAAVSIRVFSANQHQIRATVFGTSYSGQRSFSAVAGPLFAVELTAATTALGWGKDRLVSIVGTDEWGNDVALTDASLGAFALDGASTGSLTGLPGTPSISAGDIVVTVTGANPLGAVQVNGTYDFGSGPIPLTAVGFDVVAGDAATITLTGDTTAMTAGETRTVTVSASDGGGNAIDLSGVAGLTIEVTGGGSVTVGAPSYPGGNVAEFVVTAASDGTTGLTAKIGTVASNTVEFEVVAGALASAVLTGPTSMTTGETATFTIAGLDAYGNDVLLTTSATLVANGTSSATATIGAATVNGAVVEFAVTTTLAGSLVLDGTADGSLASNSITVTVTDPAP